ncbi:MAG: hypothetical protein NTZ10_04005 [Candidatus Saganbacteria bacterium]|nr:hypothetical protein [Candidatus Saganbacteria bacterium]
MNRTFWALVAIFLSCIVIFIFVLPPAGPDEAIDQQAGYKTYAKEISGSWDNITSKYGIPGSLDVDLFIPAIVGFAGIGMVLGTDIWMRRRNKDAIKRFFSHFKNK